MSINWTKVQATFDAATNSIEDRDKINREAFGQIMENFEAIYQDLEKLDKRLSVIENAKA